MPLNLVPQPTQRVSATQAPILQNFTLLQAWSIVNHTDVQAALPGWHTNLTFPAALTTLSPALTATSQIGMLPFTGATSGVCELAVQKFGGSPIAFTEGNLATAGYSRLASGLLVKWGSQNTTANNITTINLASPGQGPSFGATANIYSVQVTPGIAADGSIYVAWGFASGANQIVIVSYNINAALDTITRPSFPISYIVVGRQ